MIDNIIEDVRDLLDRYTQDESGASQRAKYVDIYDNDLDLLQLFYNTINYEKEQNRDLDDIRDMFDSDLLYMFDCNNF